MPDPKKPAGLPTQVGYAAVDRAQPAAPSHEWEESTTVDPGRAFRLDEFAGGVLGRAPNAQPGVPAVASLPMAQGAPAVEFTFVHEPQTQTNARRTPWCAVEIWTQNRLYMLDSTMTCIEVRGRASGAVEANHSLIGARMTGGQLREGHTLEISHPFPVPGSDAMFQHPPRNRVRFGQTSRVERVVVRVRITTVALADAEAIWEEITGHARSK